MEPQQQGSASALPEDVLVAGRTERARVVRVERRVQRLDSEAGVLRARVERRARHLAGKHLPGLERLLEGDRARLAEVEAERAAYLDETAR